MFLCRSDEALLLDFFYKSKKSFKKQLICIVCDVIRLLVDPSHQPNESVFDDLEMRPNNHLFSTNRTRETKETSTEGRTDAFFSGVLHRPDLTIQFATQNCLRGKRVFVTTGLPQFGDVNNENKRK